VRTLVASAEPPRPRPVSGTGYTYSGPGYRIAWSEVLAGDGTGTALPPIPTSACAGLTLVLDVGVYDEEPPC
jgi:hypothetical protein